MKARRTAAAEAIVRACDEYLSACAAGRRDDIQRAAGYPEHGLTLEQKAQAYTEAGADLRGFLGTARNHYEVKTTIDRDSAGRIIAPASPFDSTEGAETMKTDTPDTPRHVTGAQLRDILLQYGPAARIVGVRINGPADREAATRVEVSTLNADDQPKTYSHPVRP